MGSWDVNGNWFLTGSGGVTGSGFFLSVTLLALSSEPAAPEGELRALLERVHGAMVSGQPSATLRTATGHAQPHSRPIEPHSTTYSPTAAP